MGLGTNEFSHAFLSDFTFQPIEFFPFFTGNNFSRLGLTFPSYNRKVFGAFAHRPFGPAAPIEANLHNKGSIRQRYADRNRARCDGTKISGPRWDKL